MNNSLAELVKLITELSEELGFHPLHRGLQVLPRSVVTLPRGVDPLLRSIYPRLVRIDRGIAALLVAGAEAVLRPRVWGKRLTLYARVGE